MKRVSRAKQIGDRRRAEKINARRRRKINHFVWKMFSKTTRSRM